MAKKTTIQFQSQPFYQKSGFKTVIKVAGDFVDFVSKGAKKGTKLNIILLLPIIASVIWLIKLLVEYFTPVPHGVQAAPFPTSTLFALTAFMIGYSIFYVLFYHYKKDRQSKQSV